MIKINLLLAEYLAEKSNKADRSRLRAIQTIKVLLEEVDHAVEQIPEDNKEMLTRLLTSLKGENLTPEETQVVGDIVSS